MITIMINASIVEFAVIRFAKFRLCCVCNV